MKLKCVAQKSCVQGNGRRFVSSEYVGAEECAGNSRCASGVSDLLRLHGVDTTVDGKKGIVTIDASHVEMPAVSDVETLSGSSRIPILFSGPLLHRLGEAFIP